jgi:nitrite reductase (NO-forming)
MTLTVRVSADHDTSADHTSSADHAASAGHDATIDPNATPDPGFHPYPAALPPHGPRVRQVTLRISDRIVPVAPGVTQRMWTFGGTVPGPTLHGRIGDTFVVTLINDTSMGHSIDFHASILAPDGPMRTIGPGQRLVYRFTAAHAGAWMYHCATAPMIQHLGNGMYGAVVIDPPHLTPVDAEYVLVQSELYLGQQGQLGDPAKMTRGTPDAVVFNGYYDQYRYAPLPARAGGRMRIWVLDAGLARPSAFHVVGTQFDTVFSDGAYLVRPGNPARGAAQALALLPGQGGFVEFTVPAAGHDPFLSHLMVDAARGATGMLTATG